MLRAPIGNNQRALDFDIVARNGVCAAASWVADFQDYNLDRRRGAP
jgi:hypothetical protein